MGSIKYITQFILLIGMVDQVNGKEALVEITTTDSGVTYSSMPIAMFPCEVQEGSMFYFEYIDGVTEIRCGEPPE